MHVSIFVEIFGYSCSTQVVRVNKHLESLMNLVDGAMLVTDESDRWRYLLQAD